MDILSVYFKHQQGGFNQRLYRLYRALARADHRVHYVAVGPLPVTDPNIRAHILPLPFREKENMVFWLLFLLTVPLYCVWLTRKHRIQRAIVFSAFYAVVCFPAALTGRLTLTTFLRADVLREARFAGKSNLRILAHRLLEWIGLRASDCVVVNSRTLARAIAKRYAKVDPLVLPNSIDRPFGPISINRTTQRQQYGLGQTQYVVVTAAPLNRVKNIDFLINAFARAGLKKACLCIIGDDLRQTGERRRLEQLTAELGLERQVLFTGWLKSPSELLAACDLFVFPSSQEGSPNALLEAISCRIACLGSRIPEIAEVLHYDDLLFDLSSTRQLAEAIHRAGVDISYRRHLAELVAKRQSAFRFDWDKRAVAYALEC